MKRDTLIPREQPERDEHEREGVIKFTLNHDKAPLSSVVCHEDSPLSELCDWRGRLRALEMIGGGDPSRYQGAGFGNLSARCDVLSGALSDVSSGFMITGSQTGHLDDYRLADFALVQRCDVRRGVVESVGLVNPSSESLTHAALYQLGAQVRWVFHVHCPHLWRSRARLQLPSTPRDVPYGTVEMAHAVSSLYHQARRPEALLFAMDGHEDGLISFGASADQVGQLILKARARLAEEPSGS